RVPVRRGLRRGNRARDRALRRRRAGEHRCGVRDWHPRSRGADRRADRLQRPLDVRPYQAGRPAAPHARRLARRVAFRLQGDDRFPRRPAPDDRLVPRAPRWHRVKLCFFNRSYWPDQAATGQLLTELAGDLVNRYGHEVTVVAGRPLMAAAGYTSTGGRGLVTRERHEGVDIRRANGSRMRPRRFAARATNY